MNRILYSSLFALVFLFFTQGLRAQAFTPTCSPNSNFSSGCIDCFNPNGNSGQAGVVAPAPGANQYTWSIASPTPCGTAGATFTCTGTDCSTINISYPCCGQFTIFAFALNTTVNPVPPPVLLSTAVLNHTVVCSSNVSAV